LPRAHHVRSQCPPFRHDDKDQQLAIFKPVNAHN